MIGGYLHLRYGHGGRGGGVCGQHHTGPRPLSLLLLWWTGSGVLRKELLMGGLLVAVGGVDPSPIAAGTAVGRGV